MIKRAARLTIDKWRFSSIYRKFRRYTMIPRNVFMDNLWLAKRVWGIEGAIVECGTWRGGMIAGIADVLGGARSYYLFDSFQGLPPAKDIDGAAAKAWQSDTSSHAYYNNCMASEDEARTAMNMSAGHACRILKGWFEDTLPHFPAVPIALLRMDADWYDSTRCILENLGKRVVPDGLIIVDDYYTWEGCTIAVNEFAAQQKWRLRESQSGVCYIRV